MRKRIFKLFSKAMLWTNFMFISCASAQSAPINLAKTGYTIILECKAPSGVEYSRETNFSKQIEPMDKFYKITNGIIYHWDDRSQAWTYILGADYRISDALFSISDHPGSSGLIQYNAEINRSNGSFSVKRVRLLSQGDKYVSETWQGKCIRSQEPSRQVRGRAD